MVQKVLRCPKCGKTEFYKGTEQHTSGNAVRVSSWDKEVDKCVRCDVKPKEYLGRDPFEALEPPSRAQAEAAHMRKPSPMAGILLGCLGLLQFAIGGGGFVTGTVTLIMGLLLLVNYAVAIKKVKPPFQEPEESDAEKFLPLFYWCPKCDLKVEKTTKVCPHCGQDIAEELSKTVHRDTLELLAKMRS